MLLNIGLTFLLAILLFLFISLMSSPFEALGWWAGWFGEGVSSFEQVESRLIQEDERLKEQEMGQRYIVYLSGIGSLTGNSIPAEELPFLADLETRIPGTVLIDDVFPYSVSNVGLTGNRLFGRFWRWVESIRPEHPTSYWLYLIVLRNLFQVLISADGRYGPIFNLGVAEEVWASLIKRGYRSGHNIPVTLIGTSGGGQISVGVARFLSMALDQPLHIISIGGVISSDPGLNELAHLYHLYGEYDGTQALGYKVFPRRWPIFPQSEWNRAKQAGKITFHHLGPMVHTGPGSPFDPDATLEDDQTHYEKTMDTVVALLKKIGS